MENLIWAERYRPKTVEECILPPALKTTFQQFVNDKNIPDLILSGTSGIGKTTVAKAMLEEIGASYIKINASMYGNIDTLRNDMLSFASTGSLMGGKKYIILDEADNLNPNSTQPALRSFMDEFSVNCGFIFTCNYKNKITEHIHSRCSVIDFNLGKKEMVKLAVPFFHRVQTILKNENVTYDKAVVVEVIQKYFPDWRRILNELQRYSANENHTIDTGILVSFNSSSIKDLIKLMKNKEFYEIRKWVGENIDRDTASLFRKLYDMSQTYLTEDSVPQLVLLLAKYQYQDAFVADHEINVMACLTEIMVECRFL